MFGVGLRRCTRCASAAVALLASTLLPLAAAPAASATTVTLGPDLTGISTSGTHFTCGVTGGCTFSQGAQSYVSPVSGEIVRWRVAAGTGTFALRVLKGNTGGAVGPTETATTESVEEFPTAVPIRAGELVGLDLPKEGSGVGYRFKEGASIGYWAGTIAEGETRPPTSTTNGFELLFNADVQPAPGISGLSPPSGPVNAVTGVVIGGHDLIGATAVKFGTVPATAFTVDSDSQITASAPPSAAIASVPVTVTTIAGSATSTQNFSYEGCRVPKLKGKRLKAAKKQIRAAGCKLGKLTKRKSATAKKGKVAKQTPKPGTVATPGTKVKLTIKR
jgi:hypothetical protein